MTQTTKTSTRSLAEAVLSLATAVALLDDRDRFVSHTKDAITTAWKLIDREKPSPAPTPSCDAPHCDCATGEDCKANGAADPVQVVGMDTAAKTGPFPWTFTFRQDGDDMIIDDGCGKATVIKGGAKPPRPEDNLFVLPPAPAPDLAARLDGLKAAVDALAERLERGPATGMMSDPVRIVVTREGKGDLGMTTWTTNVPLRHVGPGSYVRDQNGRVAHVCSMITDTDGTSRLFVDVVDGEG